MLLHSPTLQTGPIQKLSLLLQPSRTTDVTTPLPTILWMPSTPPAHLISSPVITGHWPPGRTHETVPAQALLFTNPEAITGFSGDADLHNFALHYLEGTFCEIGSGNMTLTKPALTDEERADEFFRGSPDDSCDRIPTSVGKRFRIDGPDGEIIREVSIGINKTPKSIKVSPLSSRLPHIQTNTSSPAHHLLRTHGVLRNHPEEPPRHVRLFSARRGIRCLGTGGRGGRGNVYFSICAG